jgi:AcrR family transcriptional regulator
VTDGSRSARTASARGRRPGPTETREAILAVAREMFADKGYDGTSLRAIARAAGVDPALVHHFFGTKEGVFVEAMRFPLDPAVVLARVLTVPGDRMGEALARTFVDLWSDADRRAPVLAMLRSAMTNERVAALLREFMSSVLIARAGAVSGVPHLRIQAAVGQMVGVMVLRYVVRLEPMASASDDELVELVAPTLQHYFG